MSTSSLQKVKKSMKNKKLLDVYGEINRPDVTVTSMVLRVTEAGEVIVESCEYEEVVTTRTLQQS
jgi:hypothetical protein